MVGLRGIIFGVTVLVSGVVLGEGGKLPFTVNKGTTVVVSPLKGDGNVDYVGAVNEKYGKGVGAEENGFVKWLEVVGTDALPGSTREEILAMSGGKACAGAVEELTYDDYLMKGLGLKGREFSKADDELVNADREMWTAEEYPHVAGYLKSMDKGMALAKEAAGRGNWWGPSVGKHLYSVLLPTLMSESVLGKAFCARATERAKGGDFAGFLEDVVTVRRLARHGGRYAEIDRLLAISLDNLACGAVGGVVGSGTLTGAQLEAVGKMMGEFGPMPGVWETVDEGGRWTTLEVAELAAVGDQEMEKGLFQEQNGKEDPALAQYESIERGEVDWDGVLRRVNAMVDKTVASMKVEDLEKQRRAFETLDGELEKVGAAFKKGTTLGKKEGETREAYSERVGDWMVTTMMGSMKRAATLQRKGEMEVAMVGMLVKAAAYKVEKGKWPEKLEEAAGLGGVPVDIYSGQEGAVQRVLYWHDGMGAEVYSVGVNGMDDGGMVDSLMHADDVGVGIAPPKEE